jgi:cytochrome c peroxidase
MGLAEGESQIKGLDANPLTRAKIELGRQLYFDTRLSADKAISCANCHAPDHAFGRETRFGVGINAQEGGRNSPVAYNRILSDNQFWDGRAESLEAQAVGPIANPIEMGNTHEACVETLAGIEGYRLQFEKIFGDMTIDNVGKAIAAFERTLVTGPTPYDYQKRLAAYEGVDPDELKEDDPDLFVEYEQVAADAAANAMSDSAQRGMAIFFSDRGGCSACHVGPNLTDERYHNLGVGMDADEPDVGRFSETAEAKDTGAFKTPTIRNVALSAPYMHDGSQATLAEVVEWYAKGGHPNDHLSENVKKLDLDDQAKQDLVAFMEACTGAFPPVETDRLPR